MRFSSRKALLQQFLLFSIFCNSTGYAGDLMACDTSPMWLKWAKKCEKLSQKLRKSGVIPMKLVDAKCSESYYLTRSENTRCFYYKASFDQLHILIAEGFYSKRKDHRAHALQTLKYYECENKKNCEVFQKLVSSNIKKNILVWKQLYPDLLKLAMQLKT